MRRRVLLPTSFHGRLPDNLLSIDSFDVEEAYTGTLVRCHLQLIHLQMNC
ncbi:hypothetical protein GQ55_3G224800 [Panicum hallii var. hallii]|uniref:Uncharacterized protein n=1 Tax=Panicum hallii var. hallii TaxID=1504633 RepID=A0A2T7ECA2_9POAL|nr:hypothetical protein GQ55_3G224800 [Panicum hallii var. hallii]